MEPNLQADSKIELEVVGSDRRPVICRPIDVNELINKKGKSVEVGDGVRVRLEEYGGETTSTSGDDSDSDASYDDEEEEEEDSDSNGYDETQLGESGQRGGVGLHDTTDETHAPPGYHILTRWNDVIAAAQKRSSLPSQRGTSLIVGPAGDAQWTSRPLHVRTPISRRELWASFAFLADKGRNYSTLHSVRLMPHPTSRRFRLPPLMYHATTSFVSPVDQGQRILVYGGTTNWGKSVENELYEFSLITGHWRRIEGKQFVSPGNYGHTAVVVDGCHRLMVIGGVGPTGQTVPKLFSSDDENCRARLHIFFPYKGGTKMKPLNFAQMDNREKENPLLWSLAHRVEEKGAIGFMSMLFDMDLRTNRWRAIQTVPELPVAFHTAVVRDSNVYIFGGLTNRLLVSAQLIGIHAQTYRVSLIRSTRPSPQARYLHSAVVYGNWIIIYGGFDVQNKPLNDVWAFDILNERWEELKCHGAPTRGAHAACIVGSRLIVLGGFDTPITNEDIEPNNSIFELQLVPTHSNEYIWKELHVRPVIPALAFAGACCCADGVSFILYGGCTITDKRTTKHQQEEGSQRRKGTVSGKGVGGVHKKEEEEEEEKEEANVGDTHDNECRRLWKRLVPSGEGFAFTFPMKKQPRVSSHEGDGGTHVNALGVAVDPEEMPPEFKAFVRRQQDFIRKKNANLVEAMKKTTLSELEDMEPHMFLKPEEIEVLLQKSDEMCEGFTTYKMEMLPPNIPDREVRIKINEECISLSRQIRDVINSMKGHEIAVTTAKSKTHRKRTGEKFEDHSAAKPFRRVVVSNLLKEIKGHLKHVHIMNKALKTVEWSEKGEYIEIMRGAQSKVKAFLQAMRDVIERYIEQRIESLMLSAAKRKDKMQRLREIVEKNRHDAIFQRDTPDPQRERVKQMWQKGETQNVKVEHSQQTASRSSRGYSQHRFHSTGVGYYKDENQAMILLFPRQLEEILKKACIVQKCAASFGHYCRSKVSSLHGQENFELQKTESTNANGEELTVALPSLSSPPPPPPPPPPIFSIVSTLPSSSAAPVVDDGATSAGTQPGEALPSALVIHNSDRIRQKGADLADDVHCCVTEFARNLETHPEEAGNANSNTNVINHDKKGEIILRLPFLRPLIACKAKLIQLEDKIPGIRVNEWEKDNLAGAPQDEEAQKRFLLLKKSLSALVQRVTMSFLTKSGGRRPGTAAHTHVPHSVAIASPSLSVKGRRGVKIIYLTNSHDSSSLEECNDRAALPLTPPPPPPTATATATATIQPQEPQHPFIMFEPLSLPVYPSDTSPPVSVAKPEIPKPISLTSSEAMALAPSFPTMTPVDREGVIIPSSSDIKVIPNKPLPFSSDQQESCDPKVGVTGSSASFPPGRITLSQGPNIVLTALGGEVPAFRESSGLIQVHVNSEAEKSNVSGMVSVNPGFFHMGTDSCVTPCQENGNSSRYHNAADLEDDYFFFGRTNPIVKEAFPCVATDIPKHQVVVVDPFPISKANTVKVSPTVGTPAAAAAAGLDVVRRTVPTTLPVTRRIPLAHRSHSVHGTVVEVKAKPAVGQVFRGKLTPGEAQILHARERFRASSSSSRR